MEGSSVWNEIAAGAAWRLAANTATRIHEAVRAPARLGSGMMAIGKTEAQKVVQTLHNVVAVRAAIHGRGCQQRCDA